MQAAIVATQSQLPLGMPSPPSYKKVNPADQPILYLSLGSDTMPISKVDEYAEDYLGERISMISGVAQVQVYGAAKYAVRIQVDPKALASRGIGIDEVAQAVENANVDLPTGILYGQHQQFTVQAQGQLVNAAAYRPLIVSYSNGSPVRLADVGRVIDSVENDKTAGWTDGQPSVVLAIQRQPGTNTVQVVDNVLRLLPSFQAEMPAGLKIASLGDRATAIRASVNDVQFTLLLTVFLVVMVIFLFLRNLSATVIPSLALPMSIVGTFAVMWALSYTLDNLSLMAITLAVGFVVDDAIVMLENIVRHMEMGKGVLEASLEGSREISFTIMSMTFSLAAVFIPVLFMGGILGRLLHEFAITIGAAILVSGVVSLTLTPMLCSRFLRPPKSERHGHLYAVTERFFDGLLDRYQRSLAWVMLRRRATMILSGVMLLATIWMFYAIPKGFVPSEDLGDMVMFTLAQQGISFEAMKEHQLALAKMVSKEPAVEHFFASIGPGGPGGSSNSGILFCHLKPRNQRSMSVDQLIQKWRPLANSLPGINVFLQNPPPIRLGAQFTRSMYQFTIQSPNTEELYRHAPILEAKMRELKDLRGVNSDLQVSNPQVNVQIDRDKARSLGVSAQAIEDALYDAYGSRQISTIYAPNDEYKVEMEVEPQYQDDPATLSLLYVRSQNGPLVPLSTVVKFVRGVGPLTINHSGQLPAVTISFDLAPGVSLAKGLDEVQKLARDTLPASFTTSYHVDGAGVRRFAERTRNVAPDDDPHHLPGTGNPLRKLHPPDHDSVGTAVEVGFGALVTLWLVRDAAGPVRLRRCDHAGRPGQEERHHDDRFRTRRAAHRGQDARRGHLRGRHYPVSSDYDDYHGGPDGGVADRPGSRCGLGIAPATRGCGRWWPGVLTIPDAVHHPGGLHLHGEFRRTLPDLAPVTRPGFARRGGCCSSCCERGSGAPASRLLVIKCVSAKEYCRGVETLQKVTLSCFSLLLRLSPAVTLSF